MSTVTTAQVVEQLKRLTPEQLSIVYDFAGYLVDRSGRGLTADIPNQERPIIRISDLRMDFWPADESVDEFLAERETWRVQDLALEATDDRP